MKRFLNKSLAQAPLLRPVHNPYSVKYYVFVDGRIKDLLATLSKRGSLKVVRLNYTLISKWLKRGLKVDKSLMFFADKVFQSQQHPASFRPSATHEHTIK